MLKYHTDIGILERNIIQGHLGFKHNVSTTINPILMSNVYSLVK